MNQKIINSKSVVGNKKGRGMILVSALLLLTLFAVAANNLAVNYVSAATNPTLGATATYSILGSTPAVTNTGATHISGDVGISPAASITGLTPPVGLCGTGAGGTVGPPGTLHCNDASAIAARADWLTQYTALLQTCTQTFSSGTDLTAQFPAGVGPGVWCSLGTFLLTGNLHLIGSGVWIFITASSLTTSTGSSVTGGDACSVWWAIHDTATLLDTTLFIGSIFAHTSIVIDNGVTLNGRALAYTGTVTLINDQVNGPICAPTGSTTSSFTATMTFTTVGGGTTTVTTIIPTILFAALTTQYYPVGGEMLSVDRFTVFLPWLLLISALALIILGTIAVKKRSESDST